MPPRCRYSILSPDTTILVPCGLSCLVAMLFSPVIDLPTALVSEGEIAIHIPYITAWGGGAILYAHLAATAR